MKQVFVPEVLVGINDFHGSFEAARQDAAESTEMHAVRQQSPRISSKFPAFQYSKYRQTCAVADARERDFIL